MAGIRGLKNQWPCPVCLVPKDKQSEYSNAWPIRDCEQREELVAIALDESKSDAERDRAEAALAGMGFRICPVSPKSHCASNFSGKLISPMI
jgi:uncharacterized protein (UPF0212 family)